MNLIMSLIEQDAFEDQLSTNFYVYEYEEDGPNNDLILNSSILLNQAQ